MTTLIKHRVGLVSQSCPRNREEIRTGGPYRLIEIIPLCLANLSVEAHEGSLQPHNNGKEEVLAL